MPVPMRAARFPSRLALLAALLALAGAAARPARAAPTPAFVDAHGIRVEHVASLGTRQVAVRVRSAALPHAVDVRLLLPAAYADEPARRYPVLYLFHGTSGRAADWVTLGDAEAATADRPLIVVMPDCGFDGDGGGWFANWHNGGEYGPPMWETFHVAQLIPWVDANLRTVAARDGRALAGLSQGGFGALSYAARFPDLFTSAAAFSGACQIDRDPEAIRDATAIIQFTTSVLSGAHPDAIFGPRATQALNWQAHDPATLVTNLRGMAIALWTGNGEPGPLDPLPDPGAGAIERLTYGATRLFHGHLQRAGIAHAYHDYGPGQHTWPYWARSLREYLGPLMARFADPPPPPRAISVLSAHAQYERWGWRVSLTRDTPAFSHLRHASAGGFALTGLGEATVTTPPWWPPGTLLRMRQRGRGFQRAGAVTVAGDGRATIAVPLGRAGRPATTRVSLRPAR